MAPRTFPIFIMLAVVRKHLAHTLRRLRSNPLTKSLPITATFDGLLAECGPMQQKETDFEDQVDDREVEITTVDLLLNVIAQRLSIAILVLTKNNRQHALYQHYFGDKPLHLFIRPRMKEKYAAMQKWPASLEVSPHASLKEIAPDLVTLLEAVKKAVDEKASAEQQESAFHDLGDRKDFIDRVNVARKEAHGILSTLPHKHVGLPLNFANQFFLRTRSKVGGEVTVEEAEEELTELKKEVAKKEANLDGMRTAEEKAAKQAAEQEAAREAAKVELAALKKELVQKEKKAAVLLAVIEAKK